MAMEIVAYMLAATAGPISRLSIEEMEDGVKLLLNNSISDEKIVPMVMLAELAIWGRNYDSSIGDLNIQAKQKIREIAARHGYAVRED